MDVDESTISSLKYKDELNHWNVVMLKAARLGIDVLNSEG